MQELTTRDPDNADWQREPPSSHNRVGAVLQAQGRLQKALAEFEACTNDHAGADRARPGQCRLAARAFSVSHGCVGAVLQAQGGLQEALAGRRASEGSSLALVSATPDQAQWKED